MKMKPEDKRKFIFILIVLIFIFHKGKNAIDWVHSLFVTLNIIDNKKFTAIDKYYEILYEHRYYEFNNEKIGVKIYTYSKDKKLPAILVAHGLAPYGYDDTRLNAFARTLAKTGAVVFLPDFSLMRNIRIKSETAVKMRFLFDKMCELQYVDPNRAGFFPISYAGGPGTLAFSVAPYNERTRYIVYLGGYYKLDNVLIFGLSGKSNYQNFSYNTTPSDWGRWYYLMSNLEYVERETDRKLLREIAQIRLRYPNKNINEIEKQLTIKGQELLNMIRQNESEKIRELLNRQSDKLKNTMKEMSPENYIDGIKNVKTFILHATNDPLVPFTESFYFYDKIKEKGGLPSLTMISALEHVDVVLKPFTLKNIVTFYIPELIKMTNIVYEIIKT